MRAELFRSDILLLIQALELLGAGPHGVLGLVHPGSPGVRQGLPEPRVFGFVLAEALLDLTGFFLAPQQGVSMDHRAPSDLGSLPPRISCGQLLGELRMPSLYLLELCALGERGGGSLGDPPGP